MTTKRTTITEFVCGWCRNGFHAKCRSPYTAANGNTTTCACAAHDHVADEYVPPSKVAAR